MLPLQEIEESRRRGSQAAHPLAFVVVTVRFGKHARRKLFERRRIMYLVDGEVSDQNAAHAIDAFRILVLPGVRVACTGGQDVDVVTLADLFRQQTAQMLGARNDIRAVAWGDER